MANLSTSSVPSLPATDITCLKEQFLTGFRTLSQEQVRMLISKAAGKSCQLDPIPTPIVLKLVDVLLPVNYGVHLRTKIIENKRQFEVQKLDYPRRNLVI